MESVINVLPVTRSTSPVYYKYRTPKLIKIAKIAISLGYLLRLIFRTDSWSSIYFLLNSPKTEVSFLKTPDEKIY